MYSEKERNKKPLNSFFKLRRKNNRKILHSQFANCARKKLRMKPQHTTSFFNLLIQVEKRKEFLILHYC